MEDKEYYYSTDEEYFSSESVDELCLNDGDTYFRCEKEEVKGSALVSFYAAESIIEGMNELLYEEVGECAVDRLHVSDDAINELHQLLKDWADKNASISCWKAVNVQQFTFEFKQQGGEK
jgi:hypothetical protein